jgi:hypothetical protein
MQVLATVTLIPVEPTRGHEACPKKELDRYNGFKIE